MAEDDFGAFAVAHEFWPQPSIAAEVHAWVEQVEAASWARTEETGSNQRVWNEPQTWLQGCPVFCRIRANLAASYIEFLVLVTLCVAPITEIQTLPPLLPLLATVVLMLKLLLCLRAVREYLDAHAAAPCSRYLERMAEASRDFCRVMRAIPCSAFLLAVLWSTCLIVASTGASSADSGIFVKAPTFSLSASVLSLANATAAFDGFVAAARHKCGYPDVFPKITVVTPRQYRHSAGECLGQTTCSICLEDFEPCACTAQLPCGHVFHTDCIKTWFERNCSCPMRCRRTLVYLAESSKPIPPPPIASESLPPVPPLQHSASLLIGQPEASGASTDAGQVRAVQPPQIPRRWESLAVPVVVVAA